MQDHNKTRAIIGYSGHAYVVLDAAKKAGISVDYYCEKQPLPANPFDIVYFGNERSDEFDWDKIDDYILGIGDNQIRQKAARSVVCSNKGFINVIHPAAVLSDVVTLGEGNFIAANATINALAKISNYCILNTGCIIEHECVIADAVHIAPGAVLAGSVHIGERSFIGANAVIIQGVKIGRDVIVGAGSVVIKDIPDHEVWAGNPAKKISK